MWMLLSWALTAVLRVPWNGPLQPWLSTFPGTSIHLRFCSWRFISHPLLITTVPLWLTLPKWGPGFVLSEGFQNLSNTCNYKKLLNRALMVKKYAKTLEELTSWPALMTGRRWVIAGRCRLSFVLTKQISGWIYAIHLNAAVVLERLDKHLSAKTQTGDTSSSTRPFGG